MTVSDEVVRELQTEERIRKMDVSEIVEWVHYLENSEEAWRRRAEILEAALRHHHEQVTDLADGSCARCGLNVRDPVHAARDR